jgi:lysophospholipase L1-like esterase
MMIAMRWLEENQTGLTAAMLTLGPLLLAQGLYVRRTALRLPEPPGPREGIMGSGAELRLLVAGDSAGAGVGSPTHDDALLGQVCSALCSAFQLRWKLVAKTGFTTLDAIRCLQEAPAEPFDAVVISLGTNDVTAGRRVSTWTGHLHRLATLLRSKFQARHLIFSGLARMQEFPAFPQPLAWYMGARAGLLDRALRRWVASQTDCDFVPMDVRIRPGMMAEDGYHPSPQVYAVWGTAVAEIIRRRWAGESHCETEPSAG